MDRPSPDNIGLLKDPADTLWGADAIAKEANIVHEDGEPHLRRAYYLLEHALLPGRKIGRCLKRRAWFLLYLLLWLRAR